MKGIPLIAMMFIASTATAATTYTKEQLNSMASSGRYPEQELPVVKSSGSADFADCKSSARGVYSQVAGEYPAKVVVDSGAMYVVKVWTNDGAILVSCSQPDNKKVITQSAYK